MTLSDRPQFPHRELMLGIFIFAVTVLLYLPALHFPFINFDDPAYVSGNPQVHKGLTLDGIRWAFTTSDTGNWHPLTWLSLMLDTSLLGNSPAGYHLVNILFHALNSWLLFAVVWKMTGRLGPSLLVAGFFAVHPLNVESVAWVAERKNVLSTFFWITTLGAYTRYVRNPNSSAYLLVLILFGAGLLSKSMLVTLPCVLLLLDFWPLSRVELMAQSRNRTIRKLLIEKIPFFALTFLFSLVAIESQKRHGALSSVEHLPFIYRLSNGIVSYLEYLFKAVYPAQLSVFYPHSGLQIPYLKTMISILLISGVTFFCIRRWKAQPFLIVGWLWFLGTMVPVIGLVQVGMQSMADRYAYVPFIGLFLIVAWTAYEVWKAVSRARPVLFLICLLSISALAISSRLQLSYWRSGVTLFEQAIANTRNNDLAYTCLGLTHLGQGDYDKAIEVFQKVLEYKPNSELAHHNLGLAQFQKGLLMDAGRSFHKAVQLNPNFYKGHLHLGQVYMKLENHREALTSFQRAAELNPAAAEAYFHLGSAYLTIGERNEAQNAYTRALKLRPGYAIVHKNLGALHAEAGRMEEAMVHLHRAIDLQPEDPEGYYNLGTAWISIGRLDEAMANYHKALERNPNYVQALNNLGILLFQSGRHEEARQYFNRVLQLNPGYASVYTNLEGEYSSIKPAPVPPTNNPAWNKPPGN